MICSLCPTAVLGHLVGPFRSGWSGAVRRATPPLGGAVNLRRQAPAVFSRYRGIHPPHRGLVSSPHSKPGQRSRVGSSASAGQADERIPITVLTGFLGSGKTTTLNNLLTKQHGRRLAIIENEFGEIDIDSKLVAVQEGSSSSGQIMMLSNGCLCCTVRGELVEMILKLCYERRTDFDHIVIETTGLANPAPIIETFTDVNMAELVRLDGVVTIVDAKHIERHLNAGGAQDTASSGAPKEAIEQIAYADRIVLNKTDLVDRDSIAALQDRIFQINRMARTVRAQHGDVDIDFLIGVGGFDLNSIQRSLLGQQEAACGDHDHNHNHDNDHDHDQCDHHHCDHNHGVEAHRHSHGLHNDAVKSVSLTQGGDLDLGKVNKWLGGLLARHGDDIYRMKGILSVSGQNRRFVFQGVHMLFEGNPAGEWKDCEERESQIVFIGRDLDALSLQEGLAACRATPP